MWQSILNFLRVVGNYSWGGIFKILVVMFFSFMAIMSYQGKITFQTDKNTADVKIKDLDAVDKIVLLANAEMKTGINVRLFQPNQLNKEFLTHVVGYEVNGQKSNPKKRIRIAQMGEVYLKVSHGLIYKSPPDLRYDYLLSKTKQYAITQFVAVPIRQHDDQNKVIGFISSISYNNSNDLTDDQILKLANIYANQISDVITN